MANEEDPHRFDDEVDAPFALLYRLRRAAADRGEGRLTGNAAKKIVKDFGLVVESSMLKQQKHRYREPGWDPRILGGYTGPGKSMRDPKPLGGVIESMISSRGWKEPVAVSSVLARWDQLMGKDLSQHARPESYQDSTVIIRCDSTAWATQVKLMRGEILSMFDRELGQGVVSKLVIYGPHAPSWRRGRRVAPGGRGPRDTYG